MLGLLYIPEHLMGVETRTSLGRSRRQITMADDLGTGKHFMKDRQQIGQTLCLSRRAGVVRQSVLVQPALVADAYRAMVVRHGSRPQAACGAASSYRHDGYRSDIQSCGNYAHEDKKKHIFRVIEQYCKKVR